ncbi:MAG: hypothetical protein H6667_11260 [Ardenticatenaceae bacterium]|nr:hypothetical protein [Ardenticatenaceae bacterium]
MTYLDDDFRNFCDRWLEKAQNYGEYPRNIGDVFDKFFTLFVVYNALYVKLSSIIEYRREQVRNTTNRIDNPARLIRRPLVDSRAATEYVAQYLRSRFILDSLQNDASKRDALYQLIEIAPEFYIQIDRLTGRPDTERDSRLFQDLTSHNSSRQVSAILRVVYNIRNNLFHGRKEFDLAQERLLLPVTIILEKIVELLYEKLKKEPLIEP